MAKRNKRHYSRKGKIILVIILIAVFFMAPVFEKYDINYHSIINALAGELGIEVDMPARPANPNFGEDVVLQEGTAEVHFIDVGQGMCSLIIGSEKTALIDSGEKEYADKVADYLLDHGVDHLDYFFVSHHHSDHMGGSQGIMERIPTDNFIMTYVPKDKLPTTVYYKNLLKFLNNHREINAQIMELDKSYDLGGGLTLTTIWPDKYYEKTNDTSIVIYMTYGDTDFLFPGDIENLSESDMAAAGKVPKNVDVMSAPHHGSSTSINKDFMEILNPSYSIISCGKDNKYGHPHWETIQMYEEMGIKYYVTAESGTVVATTDGEKIRFTTEY